MHALSTVDYAIILGYLAISLCMGMIMTRKASSSLDHYFLGGHALPWWLLGIAGMANWFDLTGTMIITSFLYMMGPRGLFVEFRGGAEPRYFGAKCDRDCGLQSFLQGVMVMFRWPLMIGFAVMGIYFVHSVFPDTTVTQEVATAIHSQYPKTDAPFWHDLTADIINSPAKHPAALVTKIQSLLGPEWRGKLPLVGFNGTVNPEQILPAVLLNMMPIGLKGILVVAMFAAMMSCKNGMVNAASAFFVKDIYQNFLRPKAANRELILMSYVSTLGIVIAGFYFGVTATSINDLWGWIIMGFGAGGLAPQLLRFYWWRCNACGMFGGILAGGVGAVVQRIYVPHMPEWEQFVIMTCLSFAGTIVVSLLTEPTPRETLAHFYKSTRPFGFWKPLENEIQGDARTAMRREHLNDIVAVPFALLWQVTIFLLPMQLVIKSYTAFLYTLPLFLISAAGMYRFWWKALPPRDTPERTSLTEPQPAVAASH